MGKYLGLFLAMLMLVVGCVKPNVEDSTLDQTDRFKKYEKTDIYIDDALIADPEGLEKKVESEVASNRPENLRSASNAAKETKPGLEWVTGPNRDTTWEDARSWVQNLVVDGGGWRMPTMEELKTIYQEGDITVLANTTGRWVWTKETQGQTAWLFSFRYGIDKWSSRSFAKNHRGFAVRSRK
jgi:hypothetical protein